jgi:hypothetical protein
MDVTNLLWRADNFIHTSSSIFRWQALLKRGGFVVDAGSFSDGLLARKIALTDGMWFQPIAASIWHIPQSNDLFDASLILASRIDQFYFNGWRD